MGNSIFTCTIAYLYVRVCLPLMFVMLFCCFFSLLQRQCGALCNGEKCTDSVVIRPSYRHVVPLVMHLILPLIRLRRRTRWMFGLYMVVTSVTHTQPVIPHPCTHQGRGGEKIDNLAKYSHPHHCKMHASLSG